MKITFISILLYLTCLWLVQGSLLPNDMIGDYQPEYEFSETCKGIESVKLSNEDYSAGLQVAKGRFLYGRSNL